jgi:plasmid stabilization system protein ParE
MAFKVKFTEPAKNDVLDAAGYYYSISGSLAARFYKDYRDRINELKANPSFFSYYHEDLRRIHFDNFPYIIIYKMKDKDTVLIRAVIYSGRNPSFITQQLSSK